MPIGQKVDSQRTSRRLLDALLAAGYTTPVRTAFFGTPGIGVPALRALHDTTHIVGVVCQPDKPSGRGMRLRACEVKQAALELGLEVFQPVRVRDGALQGWLKERRLDVAVVFAYGRILPQDVLDAPRLGCVNLHASLLPKYRGAAPIQWAILNGESATGISLMKMDAGLDTGPVYTQRQISVPEQADGGQVTGLLSQLATTVIQEDLPLVFAGHAPIPQDNTIATHAPPIRAQHLLMDFARPVQALVRQVRAFAPSPAAHCFLAGKRLKILRASAVDSSTDGRPGTIIAAERDLLLVQAKPGVLAIETAQLEGKRPMDARDLINGRILMRDQELKGIATIE